MPPPCVLNGLNILTIYPSWLSGATSVASTTVRASPFGSGRVPLHPLGCGTIAFSRATSVASTTVRRRGKRCLSAGQPSKRCRPACSTARQEPSPHNIIYRSMLLSTSQWLASNIWIRDVCLLSDPSTFGAKGPNQNTCVCGLVQRVPTKTRASVVWCKGSQPKHVSNPA